MFYPLIFLVATSFNNFICRGGVRGVRGVSQYSYDSVNQRFPVGRLYKSEISDYSKAPEDLKTNNLKKYIENTKDREVIEDSNQCEHRLSKTWQAAEIEGDVILGGLMNIHEQKDSRNCNSLTSQGGIQTLECMLYTIDWVNKGNFLNGITLGAYILNSCEDIDALEQANDFIKGSASNTDIETSPDKSSQIARRKRIIGLVEATSRIKSIQVANLMKLFKIPQIRFSSTNLETRIKTKSKYFFRTVPHDDYQAVAIVEIISKLEWKSVSILYEASFSGLRIVAAMEKRLRRKDICIAVKEKLMKGSEKECHSSYDNIVKKLMHKSRVRGVVIFSSDQEVAHVMRAVRRNNCTGKFSWIGSDGWNSKPLVFLGNEDEVEGAISVEPTSHPVNGFDDYFHKLTISNNKRNPWFTEFWEQFFKCKWPGSKKTDHNFNLTSNCVGDEIFSNETGYEVAKQLQFVSDSVLAFAYALKNMHDDLCGDTPGLCDEMRPVCGQLFVNYLKNVTFKGLSGDEFNFTVHRDRPAEFNVFNFKQISTGTYEWVQVGEYSYKNGGLELNSSKITFRMDTSKVPTSVCSLPCGISQVKIYYDGGKCCWYCVKCTEYQIVQSGNTCKNCSKGTLPNSDHKSCELITPQYMKLDSYWAIAVMFFASVGIIVTTFVATIYIKRNDTPVVKASGRELSYVLLGGIFLCYALTFLLVQKPSDIKCGTQNIGIGLCFTIVYSAVLTKTNRIDRIFRSATRRTKGPNFISPRSQLIICGGIISMQLILSAMWLSFSPPKAIHYYPTRYESYLVCSSSVDTTDLLAFAYPMILIIICTIYAILTRKIPEFFNESKFIGFTMYTTCIVWLAFIPLYFTTTVEDEINMFTMSVIVNLSATVSLFCFFTPKVYIIIVHPEKNVRQSLMKQRQHGAKKDNRDISN